MKVFPILYLDATDAHIVNIYLLKEDANIAAKSLNEALGHYYPLQASYEVAEYEVIGEPK